MGPGRVTPSAARCGGDRWRDLDADRISRPSLATQQEGAGDHGERDDDEAEGSEQDVPRSGARRSPGYRRRGRGRRGHRGAGRCASLPALRNRSRRVRIRADLGRQRALDIGEPGRVEGCRVDAQGVGERLVVGPALGIRRDERDDGVLAVRADHEVEGRDALRVGQEEPGGCRRELADEPGERDEAPGLRRAEDRPPVTLAIALARGTPRALR